MFLLCGLIPFFSSLCLQVPVSLLPQASTPPTTQCPTPPTTLPHSRYLSGYKLCVCVCVWYNPAEKCPQGDLYQGRSAIATRLLGVVKSKSFASLMPAQTKAEDFVLGVVVSMIFPVPKRFYRHARTKTFPIHRCLKKIKSNYSATGTNWRAKQTISLCERVFCSG